MTARTLNAAQSHYFLTSRWSGWSGVWLVWSGWLAASEFFLAPQLSGEGDTMKRTMYSDLFWSGDVERILSSLGHTAQHTMSGDELRGYMLALHGVAVAVGVDVAVLPSLPESSYTPAAARRSMLKALVSSL